MIRDGYHQLSDCRNLSFTEYGDAQGFPIFAFHGLPGSRLWFNENDEVSNSLGIRLITVDRPGFGNSDPKPKRSFLDFSKDIEELCQQLSIKRYSVLGISGGGVYAAACALQNSKAVHKCGLISTVAPFENGKPPKNMATENRNVFILARRFPWLLKLMLNQQKSLINKKPDQYMAAIMSNTKHLCDSDRKIMEKKENAEFMLTHMGEAFKKGVQETVNEAKLFCKDWGFDVKAIDVPVEIWHGTEDTLSPIEPIQKLANNVPCSQKNFISGKGHFLTEEKDIWEKILLSLKTE